MRGCGWLSSEHREGPEACFKRAGTFNVLIQYCSCDRDGCNTAATLLPRMPALLLLLLLFAFLLNTTHWDFILLLVWAKNRRSRPLEDATTWNQKQLYTSSFSLQSASFENPKLSSSSQVVLWHPVASLHESRQYHSKQKQLFHQRRLSTYSNATAEMISEELSLFSRLTDELSPFVFLDVLKKKKKRLLMGSYFQVITCSMLFGFGTSQQFLVYASVSTPLKSGIVQILKILPN